MVRAASLRAIPYGLGLAHTHFLSYNPKFGEIYRTIWNVKLCMDLSTLLFSWRHNPTNTPYYLSVWVSRGFGKKWRTVGRYVV